MTFLISLTENDKRILIAIGLLFILVFVLVGYIALIIERVMKRQGKKAGVMMHDVVAAKVITTPREFVRFGRKKNNRLFFKEAYIPFIILLFALIIYLIYGAITHNWAYKIFSKDEGFGSLLFLWDFANVKRVKWFGIMIISEWPRLINTPHFVGAAWASYLIVPALFVGGIWLLISTQAHIARHFRIKKLSKTVFNPSLDNIQITSPLQQNINQNNNDQNNNING